MVEFNLIKTKPNVEYLKAYLFQIINSEFGLVDDIINYIDKTLGGHEIDSINLMTEENIEDVLCKSLEYRNMLPKYVYYFKKEESFDANNLQKFPVLFTDIVQVSFDYGGLIIMESFCSQIYSLFSNSGARLTNYCNDLDIGKDGLILLRTSSSFFWELKKYNGKELEEMKFYNPSEYPHNFTSIEYRDVIQEMSPEKIKDKLMSKDMNIKNSNKEDDLPF